MDRLKHLTEDADWEGQNQKILAVDECEALALANLIQDVTGIDFLPVGLARVIIAEGWARK